MKIKFKKDRQYDFNFKSEDMILNTIKYIDLDNTKEMLIRDIVRIEYTNYTNFSNYDKPYTDQGRANFYLEGLFYKTSIDEKKCYVSYDSPIDALGFKTKKEMIDYIENYAPRFIQKLINDKEVTIRIKRGFSEDIEILDKDYTREFKHAFKYGYNNNNTAYIKK